MSKKTNALKQATRAKKPKARARNHKRKRPNPLKAERPLVVPGLLGDPVFMGHLSAAIFRALEYTGKICIEALDPVQEPEGLAGTGNSGSPDSQKPEVPGE